MHSNSTQPGLPEGLDDSSALIVGCMFFALGMAIAAYSWLSERNPAWFRRARSSCSFGASSGSFNNNENYFQLEG